MTKDQLKGWIGGSVDRWIVNLLSGEIIPAICQEMEAMLGTILWRPGIGDPTIVGWVTTIGYGISAFFCFRAWWRGRGRKAADSRICGLLELSANEGLKIPAGTPESAGEAPALPGHGSNNKGTKERSEAKDLSANNANKANGGLKIPAGAPESAGESPVLPHAFSRMWMACAVGMVLLGINKQLDLQTLMIEIGRAFVAGEGWYSERRAIQELFLAVLVLASGIGLILLAWKQKRFFIQHPMVLAGIGFLLLYILLRATAIEHVGESSGAVLPDTAWWLAGIELAGIGCIGFAAKRLKGKG